jgi:hypothetical protein
MCSTATAEPAPFCPFLHSVSPAGNIVGSLIAAYMLRYGWGWSFVVPGAFIAACGEPSVLLSLPSRLRRIPMISARCASLRLPTSPLI